MHIMIYVGNLVAGDLIIVPGSGELANVKSVTKISNDVLVGWYYGGSKTGYFRVPYWTRVMVKAKHREFMPVCD